MKFLSNLPHLPILEVVNHIKHRKHILVLASPPLPLDSFSIVEQELDLGCEKVIKETYVNYKTLEIAMKEWKELTANIFLNSYMNLK